MARKKDMDWNLPVDNNTYESAQLAVLMDVRDELKKLNTTFSCYSFQSIPASLRSIRKNTAKPRKKKK